MQKKKNSCRAHLLDFPAVLVCRGGMPEQNPNTRRHLLCRFLLTGPTHHQLFRQLSNKFC